MTQTSQPQLPNTLDSREQEMLQEMPILLWKQLLKIRN